MKTQKKPTWATSIGRKKMAQVNGICGSLDILADRLDEVLDGSVYKDEIDALAYKIRQSFVA